MVSALATRQRAAARTSRRSSDMAGTIQALGALATKSSESYRVCSPSRHQSPAGHDVKYLRTWDLLYLTCRGMSVAPIRGGGTHAFDFRIRDRSGTGRIRVGLRRLGDRPERIARVVDGAPEGQSVQRCEVAARDVLGGQRAQGRRPVDETAVFRRCLEPHVRYQEAGRTRRMCSVPARSRPATTR